MKKLLLGLLGGVSLGLLFAPEKGKDLRKKLASSDNALKEFGNAFVLAGKDASTEVQELIDSEEIQELLSKGKVKAEDILAKGKDLSAVGKAELKQVIGKAKETTESAVKNIKNHACCAKDKATAVADRVKDKITEKKSGFSFFSKK